jgi:hypothetical protein
VKRGVIGIGLLCVLFCALVAVGCSEGKNASAGQKQAQARCPAAWRSGWQTLADRIDAPVYCPGWMPSPLTGQIEGEFDNGVSVKRDRSYLVSFLWHEPRGGDVHVNFRGYPGRAKIPRCVNAAKVGGITHRTSLPCFADPRGTRTVKGIAATVYTVNQGVDQWHVLYAWRRNGSLYTVSEHVAFPLTYSKVVSNLDRLLRSLVLVKPTA